MNNIDFNKWKCRCSAISQLLTNDSDNKPITEKQLDKLKELQDKEKRTTKQQEELDELLAKKSNSNVITFGLTAIKYLMAEYSYITTGKIAVDKEFMELDQLEKGKEVELESLATLCIADGVIYTPNELKERYYNEYLSGEIDAYLGNDMSNIETICDIKSVWDYPTFLGKQHEKLSSANEWQVKGYMDIFNAKNGFIADILVDTPPNVVENIKWKLLRKTGATTEESPEFKKKWEIVQRSMYFSDIHPKLRVNKKYVTPMTQFEQQRLYDKVKAARDFLNNFHEKRIELIN